MDLAFLNLEVVQAENSDPRCRSLSLDLINFHYDKKPEATRPHHQEWRCGIDRMAGEEIFLSILPRNSYI